MKHLNKMMVFPLFFGLIVLSCDLLVWNGDPAPFPNVLQKKDSLAVRAILDTNGLYTLKVSEVIDLQNSMIRSISFNSLSLTKFIFTSAFDSIGHGLGININYCPLETIEILDTIYSNLIITISHSKIKNISSQIAMLKGILSLYISNNEINYISPEFMKCNVSWIDVQYNNLCSVSDTLNKWIIKNSRNPDWKATQLCQLTGAIQKKYFRNRKGT